MNYQYNEFIQNHTFNALITLLMIVYTLKIYKQLTADSDQKDLEIKKLKKSKPLKPNVLLDQAKYTPRLQISHYDGQSNIK